MLIPNHSGSDLAPWAVDGFDTTTRYRMRLPHEVVAELLPIDTTSTAITIRTSVAGIFKPFFSLRDWSLCNSVLFFPYRHAGELVAVLVVGATPYFDGHEDVLRVILASTERAVTKLLFDNRTRRLNGVSPPIVFFGKDAGPALEREAERHGETGIVCIEFEFSRVVDRIRGEHNDLVEHRVIQDIVRVIATMLGDNGVVTVPAHSRVVVAFRESSLDAELFAHHVRHTVPDLFATVLPNTELPFVIHTFEPGSDEFRLFVSQPT